MGFLIDAGQWVADMVHVWLVAFTYVVALAFLLAMAVRLCILIVRSVRKLVNDTKPFITVRHLEDQVSAQISLLGRQHAALVDVTELWKRGVDHEDSTASWSLRVAEELIHEGGKPR